MKFKLIARNVKAEEWEHVLALAEAGMSRELIACEAYGTTKKGEATPGARSRVSHILREQGVGVTAYRNGRNKLGRAMIHAIRREADVIQSIRNATAETIAAMAKAQKIA